MCYLSTLVVGGWRKFDTACQQWLASASNALLEGGLHSRMTLSEQACPTGSPKAVPWHTSPLWYCSGTIGIKWVMLWSHMIMGQCELAC
jgi:hypothetical protein